MGFDGVFDGFRAGRKAVLLSFEEPWCLILMGMVSLGCARWSCLPVLCECEVLCFFHVHRGAFKKTSQKLRKSASENTNFETSERTHRPSPPPLSFLANTHATMSSRVMSSAPLVFHYKHHAAETLGNKRFAKVLDICNDKNEHDTVVQLSEIKPVFSLLNKTSDVTVFSAVGCFGS